MDGFVCVFVLALCVFRIMCGGVVFVLYDCQNQAQLAVNGGFRTGRFSGCAFH